MKTTREIVEKDRILYNYQTNLEMDLKAKEFRDAKWMSEEDFRELYIMFSNWTNTSGNDKVIGRLAEEFFEKMEEIKMKFQEKQLRSDSKGGDLV